MATKCTRCNGKGSIRLYRQTGVGRFSERKPTTFQCPRCKGTGIKVGRYKSVKWFDRKYWDMRWGM